MAPCLRARIMVVAWTCARGSLMRQQQIAYVEDEAPPESQASDRHYQVDRSTWNELSPRDPSPVAEKLHGAEGQSKASQKCQRQPEKSGQHLTSSVAGAHERASALDDYA